MGPGFLGYASTLMLDVVVCALVLVVPLLLFSLYTVKIQRNYQLHKYLQMALGAALLVTVGLFELDMRLHGGWRQIVAKRTPELTPEQLIRVEQILSIHLCFAVTTCVLWAVTMVGALRRFPNPPRPSEYSARHKVLGWLAAIDITLTSVTGLWWYYVAFVA